MLLRDVMQFAAMLLLVRLLSPEDYGSAALAQTIVGFIAVFSFGTLIQHALQVRNPDDIAWQDHFTAAVVINLTLVGVTLVVAWGLSQFPAYEKAALPLIGLSSVFIIEIGGSLRHRMLEARHDWKRFRILAALGSALALAVGVGIALSGGGLWALVVQPALFPLPAAIDLLFVEKWRPNWSWSWVRYKETATFGLNRMGAAAVLKGRQTFEQGLLSGAYDFAALGMFTRAQGLGTLIAGRVGNQATTALYPVLTRAEQGSPRFRKMAGVLLRGVCWTTVPSAMFLGLYAKGVVNIIYGSQWDTVSALLPYATTVVALGGISSATSNLLLANNQASGSLVLEVLNSAVTLVAAFVLIPIGIMSYLLALVAAAIIVLAAALYLLRMADGVDTVSIYFAFAPPLLVSVCAGMASKCISGAETPIDLTIAFAIFSVTYLFLLRLLCPLSMNELLQVLPGGERAIKLLRY